MKKNIITLLFLTIAGSLFAQNETGARFGLDISPQLTWLGAIDNNISKVGSKPGVAYGLMLDLQFAKNYAVGTGINISQAAGSLKYNDTANFFNTYTADTFAAATEVDYGLQYVEVPITLKLKTNEIGYITYYGQLGLTGGVAIRSRGTITTPGNVNDKLKDNFSKDVSPVNASLLAGAGIEYGLSGNTSLLAGIQFQNGFIDVTDNPKGYKSKAILNLLRLQLGVFF